MNPDNITMPVGGSIKIIPTFASFEFAPQSDITPLESAYCAFLFSAMVGTKGMMNFKSYIEEHNLQRHFK